MLPGPQNSSLLLTPLLNSSPYKDWLSLAATNEECLNLMEALRGVPAFWLEWVDKKVEACLSRGVYIDNPLKYRIKALWNGIILLQEGKFICDLVEISIRQYFVEHALNNSISYIDLINTIPG